MHSTETRNRFIELRAKGWSLARIAAELQIACRTAFEWNRQAAEQIAELRAVEMEAVQERILASHETELTRLSEQLDRIEAVLARRNLECLSTESLFCLAATVRAQIRRLTQAPAPPGKAVITSAPATVATPAQAPSAVATLPEVTP